MKVIQDFFFITLFHLFIVFNLILISNLHYGWSLYILWIILYSCTLKISFRYKNKVWNNCSNLDFWVIWKAMWIFVQLDSHGQTMYTYYQMPILFHFYKIVKVLSLSSSSFYIFFIYFIMILPSSGSGYKVKNKGLIKLLLRLCDT